MSKEFVMIVYVKVHWNDLFWFDEFEGCVHTSRAKLSPIQSSQTHKGVAVTLWFIYNGSRGSGYTPAELSRVT